MMPRYERIFKSILYHVCDQFNKQIHGDRYDYKSIVVLLYWELLHTQLI